MTKLGVNIDHVATLREARRACEPSPVEAAMECLRAGCDSIVCHLREDRRHIKDADLLMLRKIKNTRLNLEMAAIEEIVRIACKVGPDQATLVPERRQEVTTEGGLDVAGNKRRIKNVVDTLHSKGIDISLFIGPVKSQIDAALDTGARIIELHTGEYANARTKKGVKSELSKLAKMARYARRIGLEVNAGHGLDYSNVKAIADIPEINELNIGHAIVSRAVFVGIYCAANEMLGLIR